MTLNNFQWSSERTQPKQVGVKLELDAISMLSPKVDAMSQKWERLNVNSFRSSTPFPIMWYIWVNWSFDHALSSGSPFAQEVSD